MKITTNKRRWIFVAFLLAIGFLLRMLLLGKAAFPADELEFYKLAQRNQSIIELWRNPPWLSQIPLNETLTLLLVKIGLPPTPFVTRLPFALMGSLGLFFVWFFAWSYFGGGASLCTLMLAVFNPYQLYFSRTAYHYSGAVCWSATLMILLWRLRLKLVHGECPRLRQMIAWVLVAILACHMHMSVWIIVALQGLILFVFGFSYLRNDRRACWRYCIMLVTGGLALMLAMSRWFLRAFSMVEGGAKPLGSSAKSEFIRLIPAYFAGENLFAILLLMLVFLISVVATIMAFRKRQPFWSFAWIAGLHVAALMLYVGLVGKGVAKITYFSAIWPYLMVFLGTGLWVGLEKLSGERRWLQHGGLSIALGAYLALVTHPVCAIVQLDGKPLPTYKINDWVTSNLDSGTPVLVDHWLHPWNHLAVHNEAGINYTFTVPDEPIENYRQLNWRATAEDFFKRYPQAALLEVARGRYRGKVSPWKFPEKHFANVASITNIPAMTLRRYKVYPVMDYAAANTNQVLTRIFYNTTDDIISASKSEGHKTLRLYGDGWRFLKPWQPMQGWPEQLMQLLWLQAGMYADGSKTVAALAELNQLPQQLAMQYINQGRWADYRIPGAHSVLRLFNLTDAEMQATLTVTGIALSGNVRCMINGEVKLFPQRLMNEHSLPVTLQPGENEVIVAMPMNQFMLVHDVRLSTSDHYDKIIL